MEKPYIKQYPITDSRSFIDLDNKINWQKYALALDEYIEKNIINHEHI